MAAWRRSVANARRTRSRTRIVHRSARILDASRQVCQQDGARKMGVRATTAVVRAARNGTAGEKPRSCRQERRGDQAGRMAVVGLILAAGRLEPRLRRCGTEGVCRDGAECELDHLATALFALHPDSGFHPPHLTSLSKPPWRGGNSWTDACVLPRAQVGVECRVGGFSQNSSTRHLNSVRLPRMIRPVRRGDWSTRRSPTCGITKPHELWRYRRQGLPITPASWNRPSNKWVAVSKGRRSSGAKNGAETDVATSADYLRRQQLDG